MSSNSSSSSNPVLLSSLYSSYSRDFHLKFNDISRNYVQEEIDQHRITNQKSKILKKHITHAAKQVFERINHLQTKPKPIEPFDSELEAQVKTASNQLKEKILIYRKIREQSLKEIENIYSQNYHTIIPSESKTNNNNNNNNASNNQFYSLSDLEINRITNTQKQIHQNTEYLLSTMPEELKLNKSLVQYVKENGNKPPSEIEKILTKIETNNSNTTGSGGSGAASPNESSGKTTKKTSNLLAQRLTTKS